MLHRTYITILVILLSGGLASAAHRTDLAVPQTHTLEPGFWQVTVERKAQFSKSPEGDPLNRHTSVLGTSFGLFETETLGVEGGLDWQEPTSESIGRAIYGHLRVRANRVMKDGWSFAIGVEELGFVANKNDHNVIYVMMQNRIGERWIVGVGGFNGSSKFLVDENGKDDPRGAVFGLWRQIQRGRGRLNFEYVSGRTYMGYAWAGMTLELSDGVNGSIGYGFSNNPKLGKDWVLAKISADFL